MSEDCTVSVVSSESGAGKLLEPLEEVCVLTSGKS